MHLRPCATAVAVAPGKGDVLGGLIKGDSDYSTDSAQGPEDLRAQPPPTLIAPMTIEVKAECQY